ncbi:MAG: molecular chaperone DnaK [Methylococcus sp.]|nr:MAG: molecular chaperone DnaK [Methylococcus sp.]
MSSRKNSSRFIVGIDLGTTHTVLAYSDTGQDKNPRLQILEIEQLVAPGEIAARPLLPSTRYHPAEGELSDDDIGLPWHSEGFDDPAGRTVIGELARNLGAKSLGRTINSAKSWLSHASVDRNAPILPWGAADDVIKVSPVSASASYLAHARAAWNRKFPEHPLEKQDIVITIPASFDEMARTLTLEAARQAGLREARLLEEPQAVFYDWLWNHRNQLKEAIKNIRLVMICDIGGGTCDFTLIRVRLENDEPILDRVGVGDHLMLGGDNIDLTLAHLAEKRLTNGSKPLSTANLYQLIEQCRSLKEKLLGPNAAEGGKITLLGSGSRLIGGAQSVELSRTEVESTVLDGFFPLSKLDETPDRKRSGVVEFGLPYVADPAISRHIAAFLRNHENVSLEALGGNDKDIVPDAILFNGGMFRSLRIAERVMQLLASWTERKPRQLENTNPELAVAYGGVAYGIARRGGHIRIGGGSARHYFLQVHHRKGNRQQGVCILPKGTEEGQEIRLTDRTFLLRLGEPVRFHLLSSTGETAVAAGEIVDTDDEKFISLPPLAVTLDSQAGDRQEQIVELAASLTELGTLQLQCVAKESDTDQRWDVQFQLRGRNGSDATDSALPANFSVARNRILEFFGNKSEQKNAKSVKGLRGDLEKLLGNRNEWDTALIRELFGIFLESAKNRRRSANHERVWLSLMGFCLRPGFGAILDDWRVDQVWRIYAQNPQFINETQNWTEWWTLWRRVAGGLDDARQARIYDDIAKYLNPATARQGKTAKEIRKRGYEGIVRLSGVLERLPVDRKIQIGQWLIKRLEKPSEPEQSWWALGRIAARVPFHGSIHNVIPPETAAKWLDFLLGQDWKKSPHIGFAATILGRLSGDRERDLNLVERDKILSMLQENRAPKSWARLIEEVTELEESDAKRIFGEALPPGLKLLD